MLFKLALNNIKKSYKDYLIYFLTIVIGIALFYMFNSMESQKAMLILDSIDLNSIEMLTGAMSYVSRFLSVVLAFLMVYANQFLIRRRQKELGIYMTLGMSRNKISFVLVLETLIIGFISLLIGIIVGIIGSHFLSIITARLFLVDLKEFRFIFSMSAFIKSVMAYGIIFTIMIVLNVLNIMKVKLIDLLYGKNRNQKLKLKNIKLSYVTFILSLLILFYAYMCITKNGMLQINLVFAQAIIFGIIGTLLFFMSLSTILITIVKRNKKIYYFQLNMFSLRQLNSKINTTYILMSIICIMLLIAIGTFSTGTGTAQAVSKNQLDSQPVDISLIQHISDVKSIREVDLPGVHDTFLNYYTDVKVSDVIDENNFTNDFNFSKAVYTSMSLEEFNESQVFLSREPIELNEDEVMIYYNMDMFEELYNEITDNQISLNGNHVTIKNIKKLSLVNYFNPNEFGVIVAHDEMLNKEQVSGYFRNSYLDEKDEGGYYSAVFDNNGYAYSFLSKRAIISESLSLSILVSYVSIYIGIVFIMSSVVMLALQQLSEASDNSKRYELLKKLGVEESQIKHSILVQISIYFMLPLLLAIVHSIVGINVSSQVVKIFGNLDILNNMLITAGFVLAIYGSYFMITYITIKSMVLNNK